MSGAARVVVVGGGVVGLATAWRSAQRGLAVTVVDPEPGSGASRAAAGMLAPVMEASYGEERLLALALDSARRWPSFAAELTEASGGRSPGLRTDGTVAVALDTDDKAVLGELHRFQVSLGLDSTVLTSREVRRLEPALDPGVRGGLHVPGDHSVDNRRLVHALLAAAELAGVTLVREAASALLVDGDAAHGVVTTSGARLEAAVVVLATGAATSRLAGLPDGVVPPVRPVKGQVVRLRGPADAPLLTRTVRATVKGSSVYLVPRADGELVVGATVEERGDTDVTAGGVYELLRDAHLLVPDVLELVVAEVTAGLRPGSPDNAPLLGPTALPGLALATGHHRNGVLLTPVTADAVAAWLAAGASPDAPLDGAAAGFGAQRFTARQPAAAAPGRVA